MPRTNLLKRTCIAGLLFSSVLCMGQGADQLSQEIYLLYKKGAYVKALDKLDALEKVKGMKGKAIYWKGLSYARLQKYKNAVEEFERAKDLEGLPNDYHYEYGRALYATNNVEKSIAEFKESHRRGFKPDQSLYYQGFLYQLLDQYDRALEIYQSMVADQALGTDLRQSAQQQMGDIRLEIVTKDEGEKAKEEVEKTIIPLYEKAILMDKSTAIAKDTEKKIRNLKGKYRLYPQMVNGTPIPDKLWSVRANEKFSYDSNIVLEADDASSKATSKAAFKNNASLFMKYQHPLENRYWLKPELKLSHTYHFDRVYSSVYENNGYSILPALRNALEHTLFANPASVLLELEYSYNGRDYQGKKEFQMDNQSFGINVGETFSYFPFGSTTVKVKWKDLKSHTLTSDGRTYTLNLTQIMKLEGRKLLLFTGNVDFLDSYYDDLSSKNDYLLRADYIWPQFYRDLKFQAALALTLTDTRRQYLGRGVESTWNPSFQVTKNFSEDLSLITGYDFTKKYSRDKQTYAYTKHVLSVELEASF